MKGYPQETVELAKRIMNAVFEYKPDVRVRTPNEEFPNNPKDLSPDHPDFDYGEPLPLEELYTKEEMCKIEEVYNKYKAEVCSISGISDDEKLDELCSIWYLHHLDSGNGYPYYSELNVMCSKLSGN